MGKHDNQYPIIQPTILKDTDSLDDALRKFPYNSTDLSTAVPLPGSQEPGYSPVHRNKVSQSGLFSTLHKDTQTIYEVFQSVLKHHGNNGFLGRRVKLEDGTFGEYEFETYKEAALKRDQAGAGVLNVLSKYPEIDLDNFILSLYSGNTYEWIITDLACHAYSIPNTTLYDSLGPESSNFILSLTESPIIVLSKSKISKIFELVDAPGSKLSTVKVLVSMDEFDSSSPDDDKLLAIAQQKNIELISFNQLLELGKSNPRQHVPPKRSDLVTISFTSGTSGTPKGVELTHESFISGVTFCFCQVEIPPEPVSFCFLPLAHVLERFKVAFEITAGAKIALAHDPANVKTFLDDIKILNLSTHLCGVPRVYTKIEQGLKAKFQALPGLKGALIRSVISFKQYWDFTLGFNGKGIVNAVLKKLFLSKIREQIGFSDLDFLISGGAPINAESVKFLRTAFGCSFYVGYGLSESFAAVCLSNKYETNLQSVGPVGVTAELRLRDLPELDYSWSKNRSGEILLRGPQIFRRYFKDEEKTREAFDGDGWFHTGDVGRLDKDGKLMVVDRVKNFFKLAQGEYIAVEKIENVYLSGNSFMEQIFIYGNSLEDHLVSIVAVTAGGVLNYIKKAKEQADQSKVDEVTKEVFGLDSVDQVRERLASKDLKLRKYLLKQANANIKDAGLFGFEKIKNAYFLEDPLTIENDCVTPTMKLKRPIATKVHKQSIDALYAEGWI